jgi:hypothetical protein
MNHTKKKNTICTYLFAKKNTKNNTLQTRGLAILLRALANGQEGLKRPTRRKEKRAATGSSPASLNPRQNPRPPSQGEKSRTAAVSYMAKKVGKILPGVDSCAVRFTGAPGTQDNTTVLTMTQLLSSKGYHSRRNTVNLKNDALRKRASQNDKTKYFFSLPPSSVSRLVVTPAAKPKCGEREVHVSTLAQGNIVAAPYEFMDQPGVEHYLLGEVGKADVAEKALSITFFSDGESADYSWHDQKTTIETTKILTVNDVTAGVLFKTCGALAIGRRLFVARNKNPAETDDPEKEYLPATVTGYDAKTQQHQLQLRSAEELRLDLATADVRLVQPIPVQPAPITETLETPTKSKRNTRTDAARTDAQTHVHTGIAHTANINTLTERSAPKPLKGNGKRSLSFANDLPSPTTDRIKTQSKTGKKAPARSSTTENPTNDALPPAFEVPAAPTPSTNPFSVDPSRELDFDLELRADFSGFLSASCAKVASSPLLLESFFPDNDDDVFLLSPDVPMTEFSPKRKLPLFSFY